MSGVTKGRVRVPPSALMLLALVAGFSTGLVIRSGQPAVVEAARFVGGVWLDALKMTIIPLVFALVATGVASLRETARGEARRIGRRLPLVLLGLLLLSALVTVVVVPPLLRVLPFAAQGVAGLAGAPASAGSTPSVFDSLRALIPVNIVAAAAAGAAVPVVIFALVLGLALGRVAPARADSLLEPLRALADAMVVVVGWVLRVAPIGIFALTLVVGATAGLGAAAALGGYIGLQAVVSLLLIILCYPLARTIGRAPFGAFIRAALPAQAVAAGTQSSIATLPAMLEGGRRIGAPADDAAVVLPLSVAVFKITAPSSSLIVGLTLAWLAGVHVTPLQIAIAAPLAVLSTLAVLGMPGAVSFFAAASPTAVALGAPLELLPVLMAIDTIPDMFRTVANVTADLAALTMAAPIIHGRAATGADPARGPQD